MSWSHLPSEEIDENKCSSDDVQTAILAHEIAHIKHNDGAWTMLILLADKLVVKLLIELSSILSGGLLKGWDELSTFLTALIFSSIQEFPRKKFLFGE